MGRFRQLLDRWNTRSLTTQFLLAGGLASLLAMVVVGILVRNLIATSVTQNSAAATALYVDSVIAPLLPDMRAADVLDETVAHALDETLGQGALGRRLYSFRLWRKDGTILYSKEKDLVGKTFPPSDDLARAFTGELVANFDAVDDPESEAEIESGLPLLEIYNPVLQPWSGEVVAVSEFYEVAPDFRASLRRAVVWSWVAVILMTLGFFLILFAIVVRGSRKIDSQSRALEERVRELSDLLGQNRALRLRVQRASQRATALNERYLRRIGADLHDGPAQMVALAALKLDSGALVRPNGSATIREREVSAIKSNLDEAMREIRNICNGLMLPQIEAADLAGLLTRAVRAHEERTDTKVGLSISDKPPGLSAPAKLCIYRFVQEALNNGFRHGGGLSQGVRQDYAAGRLTIEVSDRGPGFDRAATRPDALGLAGLTERIESLGGTLGIETSEEGTTVRMSLNLEELEKV